MEPGDLFPQPCEDQSSPQQENSKVDKPQSSNGTSHGSILVEPKQAPLDVDDTCSSCSLSTHVGSLASTETLGNSSPSRPAISPQDKPSQLLYFLHAEPNIVERLLMEEAEKRCCISKVIEDVETSVGLGKK
ncbi:hypothetical protein ABW19_dt0204719 [Dactylella cylindrospora]|nr:hypothetical protein ABW19_dt0204719 [Dactylella cylindrospora]